MSNASSCGSCEAAWSAAADHSSGLPCCMMNRTISGKSGCSCSQECSWLHEQPDFPEMVRFIMQHGSPDEWSAAALHAASQLPQDEAFDILFRALRTVELGHASNLTQAIAKTKHPSADATLHRHLDAVWEHPALWNNADFINWLAFEATTCITHLIELGASPEDFVAQVRRLSWHVCSHNRDSCRNFLSKHYSWLK